MPLFKVQLKIKKLKYCIKQSLILIDQIQLNVKTYKHTCIKQPSVLKDHFYKSHLR